MIRNVAREVAMHLSYELSFTDLTAQELVDQRLSEVRRLGFTACVVPRRRGRSPKRPEGLRLIEAANIGEAVRAVLGKGGPEA